MSNGQRVAAVSVAGGYWTGSSAVVDMLAEHPDCSVTPGEFMLFSFGQFFQDVTHPIVMGLPLDHRADCSMHRFREFNRADVIPGWRRVARGMCARIGIYPPAVFSRRSGMANRLGRPYADACEELASTIKQAQTGARYPSREELAELLREILDQAAIGAAANRDRPPSVGVFDQMIGPPYLDDASEVLPHVRHIIVDRDWRDQYLSLRGPFRRLTGVNLGLGVRPWDEEPILMRGSALEFFVSLRKRSDEIRARHNNERRTNVLWLDFEEVVTEPERSAERVFTFLGLDASRWMPRTHFFPEVSKRRIGKWQRPEWQGAVLQSELREIAHKLGTVFS